MVLSFGGAGKELLGLGEEEGPWAWTGFASAWSPGRSGALAYVGDPEKRAMAPPGCGGGG